MSRELLLSALEGAESFISGFEDDLLQEGIGQLLAELRECIDDVKGIDYVAYIKEQPLMNALFWFIENHESLPESQQTEIFFNLSERYRQHLAGGGA